MALSFVAAVLAAYGARQEDAAVVAGHLVEADMSGLPSHGLIRVPQYVDEMLRGEIDPAAKPRSQRVGGRSEIDARRCFGQVAGGMAVAEGRELAGRLGVAVVTVRQSGHVGRVGAYAEALGDAGFLSLIFCSGPRSGHRVAPFGGRDGRLATNPVAFSIPTSGVPIVGDFSTAASPEGRIRSLRNLGLEAPPGVLLSPDGTPTTDPNVLYGEPAGTIMPLGGELLGHRGFALGLLVEAMATLLAGEDTSDGSRAGNNLALIVVTVGPEFRRRADGMAQYILTSRPRNHGRVVLPGTIERERRATATEVIVDGPTWSAIVERAGRVGLEPKL